jgi:hypothetical protein
MKKCQIYKVLLLQKLMFKFKIIFHLKNQFYLFIFLESIFNPKSITFFNLLNFNVFLVFE